MPLTAAEVRSTTFSTTRLRAGYDMDEVDAFLDIVEADVAQYADELQRSRDGEAVLRTQSDQLQMRLNVAEARIAEVEALLEEIRSHAPIALPPKPQVSEEDAELIAGDPEAASVVAIAQRTADEIVRHAEARASATRRAVLLMLDQQRALIVE